MKYNKEVFAVPNSIYDSFCLGTNELILQGAKIYLNSKAIISNNSVNEVNYNTVELYKMKEEERKIYNLIKSCPLTLDKIKINLDMSSMNIQETLFYAGNLENLKSIENDKRYTFVQGDICDKELVSNLFNG